MAKRRIDPIFRPLETPLLFAHRGGRLEVPESTPLAFEHARDVARTDVLEIDVQRTADGTLVVWHGPGLKNVRIGGFPDRPSARERWQNDITQLNWSVLEGNAWVSDWKPEYEDLGDVPEDPARRILKLEEFLALYPRDPLNLEIKTENFSEANVETLLETIRAGRGDSPVLVVSQSGSLLETYRELARSKHPDESLPTGLSAREVMWSRIRASLPLVGLSPLDGLAVQTTHHGFFTPARFIRRVHEGGGAVHTFITGFSRLPALDAEKGHPTADELVSVLERGVDGIMTDRPAQVRPLLDDWKRSHPLG